MVTTSPPKTIVKPTALGPVANTDTKLLIYGLFQKGRVLAQDEGRQLGNIIINGVRVSGSTRFEDSRTPPGFQLSAPFVFSDTTPSHTRRVQKHKRIAACWSRWIQPGMATINYVQGWLCLLMT